MDSEINGRLRRIYAAFAHVIGENVREVPASAGATGGLAFFAVDFREGLTDEELSNRVHAVIHNVANLEGHLIRWARATGKDADSVRKVVENCPELKIVVDLANNDKHGYPPRNGGRSGRSPKLVELDRGLRMTTRAEAGSAVGFTVGPDGMGRIIGDGSAAVVITGSIIDKSGAVVADLDAVLESAIAAWEGFVKAHAAITRAGAVASTVLCNHVIDARLICNV